MENNRFSDKLTVPGYNIDVKRSHNTYLAKTSSPNHPVK